MKFIAKVALTVVTTAIYLAVAIYARGGPDVFFSYPPLAAIAAVTAALAIAALFTEGNLSTGEREDRGNRWVLAAFGVIGALSMIFPPYTDKIDFWTFGGEGVRWIGAALYTIGGIVRLWPVFVLGNRFSGLVAIQKGHRLVTNGIYGAIRHPSYLGLLIGVFGWALAFRSSVGLILAALNIIPLIGRMQAEERLLESAFGEKYEKYKTRTARLIPGIY
jgi:protein-S-isoprenylcysteine O-methyltransferase Ste14